MLTRNSTKLTDPGGGPITGAQVVPSHWRNTPQSGPMPLAGDTSLALEKLHGGPITWPLADEAVDSVVSPADEGDRLDPQDPATSGAELIQDAEGLETIDRPDQPTLPFEG